MAVKRFVTKLFRFLFCAVNVARILSKVNANKNANPINKSDKNIKNIKHDIKSMSVRI